MKKIILTFFGLLCIQLLCAQHTVQGSVTDAASGESLEMVTVQLLGGRDSALVQGAQTDTHGHFLLPKISNGRYVLKISSIGYNDIVRNVEVADKDVFLKSLQMSELAQSLHEIEVRGTAAQMVVHGDTVEYNAAAFKTAENAVAEDLLKKMPGVQIDADGKITVNGEEVKKVRIDGKKFFNDDVQMATKNIPADMIDKVQVLDEKSDMAKLTGFEDDETERIINITLKANRTRGYFGSFTGAAGADMVNDNDQYFGYGKDFWQNDFRYNANAFMNMMLGNSQTTLIGGANNTNELRSGKGRSGFSAGNGITATQNLGANTSIEFSPQYKLGGNAAMGHTNNLTLTDSRKESFSNEKNYTDYNSAHSTTNNWDANLDLEAELNFDSLNTLILQPKIAYTNTHTNVLKDYTYLTESDTASYGNSYNDSYSNQTQASLRAIYRRKFAKPGRTLTGNAQVSATQTKSDILNQAEKNVPATGIQTPTDQQAHSTANNYGYSLRVSYVEPLGGNKHFLETSASMSISDRLSEKAQFDNDGTGNYTLFDSLYSNDYRNLFFSETLEMNYRYRTAKCDLLLGGRANPSQTRSHTNYGNGDVADVETNVWNFAPTASFKYKMGKKKYARIEYRGKTSQPSISQMEPARNNTDIMRETVGNPLLNPAFGHTLRMMYSNFNADRFSSLSASLRGTVTKDALVQNSIYDETGKQYTQTVNAQEAPYSLNADLMYNTPLVQKRLHLNTRTAFAYNHRLGYTLKGMNASLIDTDHLPLGDPSATNNLRAEEHLSLALTQDVVETGIRGSFVYSHTTNSLSTNAASNVYDWTAGADITLHLPYNFTISSDIGYTARYGYNLTDANEWIWNACIDKTFARNRGTLSLKAYDLLRQRKNIVEVIGDNYVRYDKSNTLPTYIMLSFAYKLNKMGNATPHNDRPTSLPADMRHNDDRPPMEAMPANTRRSDDRPPMGGMPGEF